MQFPKSHLAPAVAAIAAVLVPVVTLLLGGDPVEALVLFVVVAVLAGMYMLRRYARAQLIYRRRPQRHRRHAEGDPAGSAPAAGRADVNGHRRPGADRIARGRRRPERATMQWRVRDVMTTEVITAPDDASVDEIVALLTERQITAVPIVDRFDVVLGVVSWTDLRRKIDLGALDGDARPGWWRRPAATPARWPKGTAVEVMSGPALTIGADSPLPAAARMMYRRKVGRLLVVDGERRLRGIVTQSDLLKVHARLDAVIRDEVMHEVLARTLMVRPGAVRVTVDDGVVTLTGRTAWKSTAVAAARLTGAVPGVTDVDDRLTFGADDTVAASSARRTAAHDPLRGWWIGHPPTTSPATVQVSGG